MIGFLSMVVIIILTIAIDEKQREWTEQNFRGKQEKNNG